MTDARQPDAKATRADGAIGRPPMSRGAPLGPSRPRFLAALRRLRVTEVEIVNQVLRCAPIMLSDQRILVWQSPGRLMPTSELLGRWGTATVALSADGLAQVEPRLEGFESFVPTETCAALVEHALNPVIEVLERGAGIPLEFTDLYRGRHGSLLDDPVEVGFVVYERDMKPLLRGYVRAPADCWRGFEIARLPTLSSRRFLAVPARLAIQLGAARITVRELRDLAVGDAVRVCKRAASGDLAVLLTDSRGRPAVRARVADDTLTLEHAMSSTSDIESAATATMAQGSSAETADDVLGEIECDVTFELGAIRMPVAEIARLRAGQSVRLGVRLQDQPVRVMVNGRPIAKGDLAALGDELVVVITDTSRLPHV